MLSYQEMFCYDQKFKKKDCILVKMQLVSENEPTMGTSFLS